MTKWSGLNVSVTFDQEPDPLPETLPVRIKGLSFGASHPKGFGIFLKIKNGQRSYSQYGLIPGLYLVYVDEEGWEFSNSVDLQEGRVNSIEVRLKKR
jgi:hypothetical protein